MEKAGLPTILRSKNTVFTFKDIALLEKEEGVKSFVYKSN